MNKLKTFFLFLCAFLVAAVCLMTGCGRNETTRKQTPIVICTTYPVWLITRSLMQGALNPPELQLLIPSDTGCPHDYALSTSEILKVSKTYRALLVRNGGSLDAMVYESLKRFNGNLIDCNATGLKFDQDQQNIETEDCLEHSHGNEHGHVENDPHLFTAPGAVAVMVRRIADSLCRYDPANAGIYQKNSSKDLAELEALSAHWKNAMNGMSVMLMHDSFSRFAGEGGMKIERVIFEGHISELSPAEIRKITETVKTKNVRLLIAEPQTPEKVAKLIAEETGIVILKLDPAASGSTDVPMDHLLHVIRANIEAVCAFGAKK